MKVLLIEDDQLTSSTLAEILTAHQYTVNLATDGQTGLDLAESFKYDLILLDVELPTLDGISLCKQLRTQGCETPILMLTGKDSNDDQIKGLDSGADDYVVKPVNIDALLARMRALLRRGKAATSSMILWENLRFDCANNAVSCENQILHFTPKEYCLLELFLLNPKRIFSRRAILDRLWDFASSPGEETVSTHIKCLRQKLKAVGAGDPVETVHGLGYRLREPSQAKNSELAPVPKVEKRKKEQPQTTEEKERQQALEITSRVWKKFKGKVGEQITILEQVAQDLMANELRPELQQQAKQEAHKLAGSLGIFGMMNGSRIAKQLEEILQAKELLALSQAQQVTKLVTSLRQELKQALEHGLEATPPYSPLVLIIDDDLMLAEKIRIEAFNWGLRVEVATDLSVARKILAQIPPDVILLDLNFPSAQEDGLTMLRELSYRIPRIPVLAFTGREDLKNRVEVARLGGWAFLHKPLPIQEILKAVTEVLKQSRKTPGNKVLIVDDDPAVIAAVQALLEVHGLEVETLQDPQQFWQKLVDTNPDLLILDLEMPDFDGIDLCQVVRNDTKWGTLPIFFLSTHSDADILDRAFAAGADDYLNKSIADSELANRVIRRLRRVGVPHR